MYRRHLKRQYPQWHESKDKDAVLVEEACTTGSIMAVRVGCLDEALPTALGTVVAWKDAVNMMAHKTGVELVRRRAVQEDWLRVTLRELLAETLEETLDRTKAQRRGRRRSALMVDTQDMELGAATRELDVDWLRNPCVGGWRWRPGARCGVLFTLTRLRLSVVVRCPAAGTSTCCQSTRT